VAIELHAGLVKGDALSQVPLWHTDSQGKYWSGADDASTPVELLKEC
jgi:hypothetical protein